MDCQVVTSLGVVNVSRLASLGGKATSPSIGEEVTFFVTEIDTLHHYICISDPKTLRRSQAARNDPLIQKRYVTHRLLGMIL